MKFTIFLSLPMNNIEYHGRFLIIANFSPVNDTKKKKDTIGLKLSKKKKTGTKSITRNKSKLLKYLFFHTYKSECFRK